MRDRPQAAGRRRLIHHRTTRPTAAGRKTTARPAARRANPRIARPRPGSCCDRSRPSIRPSLPPREWLYGRHFQRGTVSGTIAPGGYGKSTKVLVEGVAMATCRNLLSEQPGERVRVWYHNGEDTYDELQRRVAAICQHYKIPQEELAGWFFMTTATEVPLKVASGYSELKIDKGLVD